MKMLKWLWPTVAVLAFAACGGSVTPSTDGGGDGGVTPTAADLSLVLNTNSLRNTGSETVTVEVSAVDASRNALSGIPIRIAVDSNAVAVVGATETDATGKVTATVSIGADRSNRIISVTATSGSLVRSGSFQVIGATMQAVPLPAIIAPGDRGAITFRLIDANTSAMVGLPITVRGNGVPSASGVTGNNGEFTFEYTAPAAAGNLSLTAEAGGVSLTETVLVQSGPGSIPAVNPLTSPVLSASISANPSVVSVNTDGTSNRSELRALFLGADNAPISNIRVRFDLAGDANSIGGTFSTGTNIIYSNASGIATSAYIPGSRSSPTDGVTVRACWDYDDFAVGECPRNTVATLTVNAEALAVTIGTNNEILNGPSNLTYIKRFVVLVVDSAGQAKADVQVSPSVDLLRYSKGFYGNAGAWSLDPPLGFSGPTCDNEDLSRNGILEAGDDINENRQLDPRKSDVAISIVGSNRTNSSGVVVVQIEYPKNTATWVEYNILVAASGIAGTEGRANWIGVLPAPITDFTAQASPPFVVSPYGRGNVDTNGDLVIDCRDAN